MLVRVATCVRMTSTLRVSRNVQAVLDLWEEMNDLRSRAKSVRSWWRVVCLAERVRGVVEVGSSGSPRKKRLQRDWRWKMLFMRTRRRSFASAMLWIGVFE